MTLVAILRIFSITVIIARLILVLPLVTGQDLGVAENMSM